MQASLCIHIQVALGLRLAFMSALTWPSPVMIIFMARTTTMLVMRMRANITGGVTSELDVDHDGENAAADEYEGDDGVEAVDGVVDVCDGDDGGCYDEC